MVEKVLVHLDTARANIAYNVLGLCEEAELEAQMFGLVQKFIRIPNVQSSTEPAFLQNPCYLLAFSRL